MAVCRVVPKHVDVSLFGAVLVEGVGCRGIHHARWSIAACLQCWKIVVCLLWAQSARRVVLTVITKILLRKWPSTVVGQ